MKKITTLLVIYYLLISSLSIFATQNPAGNGGEGGQDDTASGGTGGDDSDGDGGDGGDDEGDPEPEPEPSDPEPTPDPADPFPDPADPFPDPNNPEKDEEEKNKKKKKKSGKKDEGEPVKKPVPEEPGFVDTKLCSVVVDFNIGNYVKEFNDEKITLRIKRLDSSPLVSSPQGLSLISYMYNPIVSSEVDGNGDLQSVTILRYNGGTVTYANRNGDILTPVGRDQYFTSRVQAS